MHVDLRSFLVVAIVLAVLRLCEMAHAAPPPLAPLTGGKSVVSVGELGVIPTWESARTTCLEKGGLLPADYSTAVQAQLISEATSRNLLCHVDSTIRQWNTDCYGFYTAGFAERVSGGSCFISIRETASTALVEGAWKTMCPYRWNVGWFSRFNSSDDQAGTWFHNSVWADVRDLSARPNADVMRSYEFLITDPSTSNVYASGPINGFDDNIMWNSSYQCTRDIGMQCVAPHGNPYVGLSVRTLSSGVNQVVRVDVPAVQYLSHTPFAPNRYGLMCQWQGAGSDNYYTTPRPPAYAFVSGRSEMSWAQRYWWVIFLVIAVAILIALILTLVYFSCRQGSNPRSRQKQRSNGRGGADLGGARRAGPRVGINPFANTVKRRIRAPGAVTDATISRDEGIAGTKGADTTEAFPDAAVSAKAVTSNHEASPHEEAAQCGAGAATASRDLRHGELSSPPQSTYSEDVFWQYIPADL